MGKTVFTWKYIEDLGKWISGNENRDRTQAYECSLELVVINNK